MTDCGCDKALNELEELIHDELAKDDAADIRAHMAGCPGCAEEHRIGMVLTETVKRACRDTAPEELRQQVLARLRATAATH